MLLRHLLDSLFSSLAFLDIQRHYDPQTKASPSSQTQSSETKKEILPSCKGSLWMFVFPPPGMIRSNLFHRWLHLTLVHQKNNLQTSKMFFLLGDIFVDMVSATNGNFIKLSNIFWCRCLESWVKYKAAQITLRQQKMAKIKAATWSLSKVAAIVREFRMVSYGAKSETLKETILQINPPNLLWYCNKKQAWPQPTLVLRHHVIGNMQSITTHFLWYQCRTCQR